MPQARITQVRDALAAYLDAAWTAAVTAETFPVRTADDEVIAKSRVDFALEPERPADYAVGRKVCVFEQPYQRSPVTRGEDVCDYQVMVWVIEHYTQKGDPTEEWLDDRKHFVEWLYKTACATRTVRLLGTLWPQEYGEVIPYDPARLAEYKQFWSSFPITFREHADPS